MHACNQAESKSSAKVGWGTEQLCAGLECGIDGSLHVYKRSGPRLMDGRKTEASQMEPLFPV